MHQAALFGGRMWGAFKDHATPFQSRATAGNETLPDARALLDDKYIHAFMYISNTNLTQPRIMHMQGSDFVIPDMHEVLQSEMYK